MATVVETSSGLFFIDPGAALAPVRYGLRPHRVELETLSRFLGEIYRYMSEVDHVIITHYHRDHYLYRRGEEEYYSGKSMYVKNPYVMINPSQRIRAYVLFKKMNVESKARSLRYIDNHEIEIDDITLYFSNPLPHGECNTRLGWVIAVSIVEDDYVVTHASDIQGCACSESCEYILRTKPDLLIISGPPTYLNPRSEVVDNTIKLVKSMKKNSTIVLDHHFLRDRNYVKYMDYLRKVNRDVRVLTAAEYMGLEIRQLEAYRDVLWGSRRVDYVEESYEDI